MPRTNIDEITVSVPKGKREELHAFARENGWRSAGELCRALLAQASGLDLGVQWGSIGTTEQARKIRYTNVPPEKRSHK